MSTNCENTPSKDMDRRAFIGSMSEGLAGVALLSLLGSDARGETAQSPKPSPLHFPPKAKRVLQIFCPGGVSHMDTFDYKPSLAAYHGKPLPGEENFFSFQGKNGNIMQSPWKFSQHGETGKWISDLLPNLAQHVDSMAFLHGMTSKSNTHGPGCVFMNTGFVREGYPSNGAWISYALGSENRDLPAYIAIADVRGEPPNGPANWNSGFLPAKHQAIALNAAQPIRNLARPGSIAEQADVDGRNYLMMLNERHRDRHPGDSQLAARVAAYELAARMQLSAPQAADLGSESAAVHKLYGTEDVNPLKAAYARNCLLARRLLERDVRFVTLYCGSRASGVDGLLNWDAHKTLKGDYDRHCAIFDQPTAALLTDLKSKGLLDDTLVLWTTEFGRMPTHQQGSVGRDHNPDGFTVWMMGAGIKPGTSYGATDEFGRRAVENETSVYDLYATVLKVMGLDHEKLTYYHNGIDRRLTDVHGHAIEAILS